MMRPLTCASLTQRFRTPFRLALLRYHENGGSPHDGRDPFPSPEDVPRSRNPARAVPQDAPGLLRRGGGAPVRPAEQVLVPRIVARPREASDRLRDAPQAGEGLVLSLLQGEGPDGGAGDAAQ